MPSTSLRRAFDSQSPSPPPSFSSPNNINRNAGATAEAEGEDEDDYMNMIIEEPKKGRESLVEKQRRRQREVVQLIKLSYAVAYNFCTRRN